MDDERDGSVAFRYSAGSKVGWRKGWRVASATCVDFGAVLSSCDVETAILENMRNP